VTVECVDSRILHRAFVADGDVASRCLWELIEDERRLHMAIVGLGRGGAQEPLAMLLIDFRNRLAKCGQIAPDALVYRMPLTQSHLADLMGLTSIHVNRLLRSLREQNIAAVHNGVVTIVDWDSLVSSARSLLDNLDELVEGYSAKIMPASLGS